MITSDLYIDLSGQLCINIIEQWGEIPYKIIGLEIYLNKLYWKIESKYLHKDH